jgi:hypothetical protein
VAWDPVPPLGSARRATTTRPKGVSILVIEIVDSEEKIREFPPVLDTMMTGGLVTLGEVQILKHGAKEDRPPIGSNERTKTVV